MFGAEESSRRRLTRRELVAIVLVAALLLTAAVTGVLALNREVFSARGFVTQYMSALTHHDVRSVLSMPGVPPEGVSPQTLVDSAHSILLSPAAIDMPTDFRIVGEQRTGDAATVAVAVAGSASISTFQLRRIGSVFGVFEQWAFATSPLARLTVETQHATFFDVNDFGPIDIAAVDSSVSPEDFGASSEFWVFAPGTYRVAILSTALTAPTELATVTPGSTATVSLTAEPTAAFNARVQGEVDAFLAECVRQHVLNPTGCPFGIDVANRVVGEPTWTLASSPKIVLVAGEHGWELTPAPMTLLFTADIQSLYDGSVSTVSQEVPLTLGGAVQLSTAGDIGVLLRRMD